MRSPHLSSLPLHADRPEADALSHLLSPARSPATTRIATPANGRLMAQKLRVTPARAHSGGPSRRKTWLRLSASTNQCRALSSGHGGGQKSRGASPEERDRGTSRF